MPRATQRANRRPPRVAGQRRTAVLPDDDELIAAPGPEARSSYAAPPVAPPRRKAEPSPRRRRALPRPRVNLRRLTGRGSRLGDIVGLALVAALVVLLTLGALLLQGYLHTDAKAHARDAAVSAAKTDVTRVLSYDYRHFDADVTAASKNLTATFRKQYQQTQTDSVRKPALTYKATVSADVVAAGAVDVKSTGHVVVLLFVDQTSSNTKLAAPRIDRSRVRVDMRKVNGHWLVNSVTPL